MGNPRCVHKASLCAAAVLLAGGSIRPPPCCRAFHLIETTPTTTRRPPRTTTPATTTSRRHLSPCWLLRRHHRDLASPAIYVNHPSSTRSSMSSSSSPSSPSSTGNLVAVSDAVSAHGRTTNDDGGRNVFVDGSWHMPMGPSPRNSRSEFASGPRIPGAVFFDIDDVSSPHPTLPHMRPSPALFARAMDRMGISPEDVVYVYASEGCAFAHRAYWTFAFGGYHDPRRVKLVQGSLDEWQICGGALDREAIVEGGIDGGDVRLFRAIELETDGVARPPRYVLFRSDNDGGEDLSVADVDGVLAVVDGRADDASTTVVVDARSAGRFHGRDPEPRPGLRGGHIPGSVNVPFMSLLDPNDVTRYRPMEEVRAIFVGAGIEPLGGGDGGPIRRRVICTCGSGMTAAALAVGLEECGLREKGDISIYDGSWIDWGGRDDTPISTD